MARERSIAVILRDLKDAREKRAAACMRSDRVLAELKALNSQIPALQEQLRLAIARLCNQELGGTEWLRTPAGQLPKELPRE